MEQKYSSFDRVMEQETISKNGESSKSQTSRIILNILAVVSMMVVFIACDDKGEPEIRVTSVSLNKTSPKLIVGEMEMLTATIIIGGSATITVTTKKEKL